MSNASTRLATTWSRLAFDAPQVVAARLARLGVPGSSVDWPEAHRMVWEKQAAALESGMRVWHDVAVAWQRAWFDALMGRPLQPPTARAISAAANGALRPWQARASANARRLGPQHAPLRRR